MNPIPTAHKGIVMIKRRPGTSRDEFRDWFLGPHAHFGTSVDEIYRYTGSLVVAPGPRYEFAGGEPPFDMISEIWCRDRNGIEQAFAKLNAMGGPASVIDQVSDRVAFIAEEYTLK
jgi:hypothetical protein